MSGSAIFQRAHPFLPFRRGGTEEDSSAFCTRPCGCHRTHPSCHPRVQTGRQDDGFHLDGPPPPAGLLAACPACWEHADRPPPRRAQSVSAPDAIRAPFSEHITAVTLLRLAEGELGTPRLKIDKALDDFYSCFISCFYNTGFFCQLRSVFHQMEILHTHSCTVEHLPGTSEASEISSGSLSP